MRSPYGKCLYIFVLLVSICTGFPIDERMDGQLDNSRFPWTRRPWAKTRALRSISGTNTGRIEAQVYEEYPSELLTRHASSFPLHRKRSSRSVPQVCIKEHFSSKAYQADWVVRAKVQGLQEGDKKRRRKYKVQFKVMEIYKSRNNQFDSHKNILISFANTTGNCVKDEKHNQRGKLVRADIKMSQQYILFLKMSSNNKTLNATSAPELLVGPKSAGIVNIVKKVCATNFTPKNLSIVKLEEKSKKNNTNKLHLVCKVKGLPIYKISWKFNNDTISSNKNTRIRYLKKSSVLVVKQPLSKNFGHFECIATPLHGQSVSKAINVYMTCNKEKDGFCLNSGLCYTDLLNNLFCECADGFGGERCDTKNIVNPSAKTDSIGAT